MPERVLVIGASGMLGAPVARQLAADGYTLRALSRNPERAAGALGTDIEIVRGDVEDADSLRKAMGGCQRLHLSVDGAGDWDLERRGATHAARAASELGLRRITYISGASAFEENAWFPMTHAKVAAEKVIRESGVPFTFFKCTMFNEALPRFVHGNRAMVMGRQPHRWHFLAAEDYARAVSRAHGSDHAAGKALFIYGPEALTVEEALRVYCARCAPQAQITHVPFWVLSLMARLPGRQKLKDVGLPMMRYFSRVKETGDPAEANDLLGPCTTTLAQWCERQSTTTCT